MGKRMGDLLNERPDVQEVVEYCLSYFSERLFGGGSDEWAEIEMLCDDIGITESELMCVFNALGYEKEEV